jgi:hypothetical protein
MADEGAFIFDNRMAGYGAEPTLERPIDDAGEWRFVADGSGSLMLIRLRPTHVHPELP